MDIVVVLDELFARNVGAFFDEHDDFEHDVCFYLR
jgi:hypothetical protein